VLVHWASLDAHTTKRVVQAELLVLALAFAWRMRRAVKLPDDSASLADEWAVVCIFVALLSPLCWLQHLVLVIPASIIIAQRVATRQAPPWQLAAAGVAAAFMLLVHRDLLGVAMCDLLSSFQPHAVASLLLAAIVLGAPRADRADAQGAGIDRITYRAAA